ncbi:hypothetical protein GO001_34835 [Streptomyces sp. NRRL B-1677]|uniref:NucA/NucB deoxyribonuclease domain-containing protein n=1 Tax=Streptomyces TaxID=1883 RepID=UPI0018928F44|nr:hypothetical protein [Streptomyces sp. NRRL B-1677]MBF6050284.1 hypothetical protein [Streptomyces sp. NRRL B-1677]
MRIRTASTALAALLVLGGSAAAHAAEQPAPKVEGPAPVLAAEQHPGFMPLNGPRPSSSKTVSTDAPTSSTGDCADVQKNPQRFMKPGEDTTWCFSWDGPSETAKNRRSITGTPGMVWCDVVQGKMVEQATRESICGHHVFTGKIIDKTGLPAGEITGTVAQEVFTKNSETGFDENFFLRITDATGEAKAGMTASIAAECVGACQQGPDPWKGNASLQKGTVLEGTWHRSWTGTTGHAGFKIGYALVFKSGNKDSKPAAIGWTWAKGADAVRCDNEITKYAGCAIPTFTPTMEFNRDKYPSASDYMSKQSVFLLGKPGNEYYGGKPLHREADDKKAGDNRNVVCDKTFNKIDNFSGKFEIQCDEYPFARTKESGGQLGIKSGSECAYQGELVPGGTQAGGAIPNFAYSVKSAKASSAPAGTAACARSGMSKNDNEGIGGDLARFFTKNRVLDNDPFWVY